MIITFFKTTLFYLFDSVLLLFTASKSRSEKKNVLVVRVDAIGDFILWLDSAKTLRELYPEKEYTITVVVNEINLLLAETLTYFDNVYPVNRKKMIRNPFYRIKFLYKIKKYGFDIAIQPTFSREFSVGDSIIRASGAKERIGYDGDDSNISVIQKKIIDKWYTKLVPSDVELKMELIRNAEFIRYLGLKEFKADIPIIPSSSINNSEFKLNSDYFVIFPGAAVTWRQWNIENFADIAVRMKKLTEWDIVICGGPGEENLGEKLSSIIPCKITDLTGKTSILELISVIKGAKFLIANETSAIHIAAAVGVPSVCILGGGHYERFVPYKIEKKADSPLPEPAVALMDCFGCNWKCKYYIKSSDKAPCIDKVSVDSVWNVINRVLSKYEN
ncbi:MAG: glycosyltransferase family 9 protein [Desulfuromonadales bacterium]|nr:glycosyltransferase family 9 protein [Desulfuromonadales bacterium]